MAAPHFELEPVSFSYAPEGADDDPAVIEYRLRTERWLATQEPEETPVVEGVVIDAVDRFGEHARHWAASRALEVLLQGKVDMAHKVVGERLIDQAYRSKMPVPVAVDIQALVFQEPGKGKRFIRIERGAGATFDSIRVEREARGRREILAQYGKERLETTSGNVQMFMRQDRDLVRIDISLRQLKDRIKRATWVDGDWDVELPLISR